MEQIIPAMLFLIGWHPDNPEKFSLERHPVLFMSMDECQEVGTEMIAGRKEYRTEFAGAEFEFRCLPVPASKEFQDLFEPEL